MRHLKVHVKAHVDSVRTLCGRQLPRDARGLPLGGPVAILLANCYGYANTGLYNEEHRCKQCVDHDDYGINLLAAL